ncbi:hypothetical protein [Streptomyces solicathayae]|uniref:RCC1-like domain-containing protein n=1 Tax=Streptomyces solicathayae TaxID=3081768 RepID=A0ABZ0M3K9_9ACTN|nr:hypothetical protein [Streptomyces sp. HUAS YS2]WOX26364.1 hypothetical protein R2D22_35325 [Streptomyces sp. HUAS YS2]
MQLLQTRRHRPRTALSTGLLVLLTTLAALPAPPAAAQAQRVESWGSNHSGQLGDGTTDDRHTPVTAAGLTAANVTGLAAGGAHGLALLSNGTVKAWGGNSFGELGDGTTSGVPTTDHRTPGTVRELSGVTAVAAGCSHSLALLSNGTVKAWGNNFSGQLGDGTTLDISNSTPVTVIDPNNPSAPLSGVTAIAAGCDHSLALLSNGTVRAWGANGSGQLGNGTTGADSGTPVTVIDPNNPSAPLTRVRAIDAGWDHSLALLSNATVKAWGDNEFGQLGNGTTGADSGTPVTVIDPNSPGAPLSGIRDIDAGGDYSLALLSDRTVKAWGTNGNGQLGNGSDSGPPNGTPNTVLNLTGVRDISAGDVHSLARLSDGTLRAWGDNEFGQLGVGSTTDNGTPLPVRTGIGTITHIAAGGTFSLAA